MPRPASAMPSSAIEPGSGTLLKVIAATASLTATRLPFFVTPPEALLKPLSKMRNGAAKSVAYLAFLLISSDIYAAEASQIACPTQVEIARPTVQPPSGNWTLAAPDRFFILLSQVDVYDGPPEEQAALVGNLVEDGNRLSEIWDVADIAASPRGVWLVCNYWVSNISLTQRLPASFSNCRLDQTVDPRGVPNSPLHVACR